MVLGYHVMFGTYGFWLPNDPRGSWSDFVGSWELVRFGRATKTDARHSVADKQHDRELRQAAKRALKYPPVQFTGEQARAAGRGFATGVEKSGLSVWSCCILPEHVHLVIARHRYEVEQVVNLLKGEATKQLAHEEIHPLVAYRKQSGRPPSPWAQGQWKVFLNTQTEIQRAIRYVENNPLKEGKPVQTWPFVTPHDALAAGSRLNV